MATAPPHSNKPHHKKSTSKSSSSSNSLCKSLIAILVLVIIPMFPSQAPDFIRNSIFPDLWELLHLMFIGIAVCYGLFSEKTDTIGSETHPRFDASNANWSGISTVSSIFDNGCENLYGSGEEIAIPENRDFQNLQNECLGREKFELDEDERYRSFVLRNGISQNLNSSQYCVGESMVLVANRNQGIVNPISHFDHKPLGLPIRSLRSLRVADTADCAVDKSRSFSSSDGSFMGNVVNIEDEFEAADEPRASLRRSRSRRELGEEVSTIRPTPQYSRSQSATYFEFGQFRSMSSQQPPSSQSSSKTSSPSREHLEMPNSEREMDLEELPDPISQPTVISVHGYTAESSIGSSSELNMQIEEEFNEVSSDTVGSEVSYAKAHSHYKLHSIGEHDHRRIKSWSFWHPTNSKSSSPTKYSPISSPSHELPNIEVEKNYVEAPSILVSHPIVTSTNGESKFIASKNQWSSPEMNAHGHSRDIYKDVGEDSLPIGKRIDSSLDSHTKPSLRRRVLLRGKSVRTIRSSRRIADDLKANDSALVKSRMQCDPHEALSDFSPKENGRKEESVNGDVLESREDSASVLNYSDTSSDEEKSSSYLVDDVELGSEVDRKAGEFIEKFKAQIRLQKVDSFRRSST